MSRVTELLKKIRSRSETIAGKFFTPKEYKSALIFLGLGVTALLYRGGKIILREYFPSSQSAITRSIEYKNDSIFAYLSSRVVERDSLDMSLSEDSITQRLAEKSSSKSGKEKSLTEHSIALNSADSITFQRLPAVGVVTARRIVAYRSIRGKFRTVKELMNVEGIGEGKFKKMEPYLRLD
jgi:competence ComEA-like helix-hairpin-helix protein